MYFSSFSYVDRRRGCHVIKFIPILEPRIVQTKNKFLSNATTFLSVATKVLVTKLQSSRPQKSFIPPPLSRVPNMSAALLCYADKSVLRCSCCNDERFCCVKEACSLLTPNLIELST